MGYVPGFEHDVFISYACKDNPKLDRANSGWVDLFHKWLEPEINRALRRREKAVIWRDVERIDCGDVFKDSIAQGIGRSATLVVLLSKQYLASNWCEKERYAFRQTPNRGAGRVFVVTLANPAELMSDGEALPDGLSEIQHAALWREVNKRSELLGYPLPDLNRAEHQAFFNEVLRIADSIAQKLDDMRMQAASQDQKGLPPGKRAPANHDVYIAMAPRGTDEARFTKELLSGLTSSLPPIPAMLLDQLPDDAEMEPLRETLKGAKLFVQVAGYSPLPRDGLQTRLAEELQVPMLIWKQGDVDTGAIENISDRHRSLLSQARKGTLDDAVRAIAEQLEKLKETPPLPTPRPAERKLFINHLPEDRELGARVFKLLTERQRLRCVKRPLDGASEAALRTYFEKQLLECCDMVLVYGKASRLSVNDQAELCYQMLASRKDLREIEAQWTVISGPPQASDSQVELDVGLPYIGVKTVDGRSDLETALAAAFQPAGKGAQP